MEDALIIAIGWIGAVVIGYLAAGVRLGEVLQELRFVKSNIMTDKASLGGAARVQNEARLEEALIKLYAKYNEAIANGGKPDFQKMLMEVGGEYPDVAVRLAKKGLKIK